MTRLVGWPLVCAREWILERWKVRAVFHLYISYYREMYSYTVVPRIQRSVLVFLDGVDRNLENIRNLENRGIWREYKEFGE